MERFNGIPAHPLFVHAPVVLVPLAMLATLAAAIRPGWRQRFGPGLAVLALVSLIGTFLAVKSGEAFNELIKDQIDATKHRNLALTTRLLVIAFTVGTLAYVGLDRFRRADDAPAGGSRLAWAVSGLTAVVGVAATLWIYRTGEAGAHLTWDGFLPR